MNISFVDKFEKYIGIKHPYGIEFNIGRLCIAIGFGQGIYFCYKNKEFKQLWKSKGWRAYYCKIRKRWDITYY